MTPVPQREPVEGTFLGEEFLTWLWYRCETEGGDFDLGALGSVSVWPDDYLLLRAGAGETLENILRHGHPSSGPEAKAALAAGKKLSRGKFVLAQEDLQWTFTLSADHMDLGSVKCPPGEESEPAQRALETVSRIERLQEVVDSLYRLFLETRLSEAWEEETLPGIRRWIAGG